MIVQCYVIITPTLVKPTIQQTETSVDLTIIEIPNLVNDFSNFLHLNVGFITHETVGYSRDFPFELPVIQLTTEQKIFNLTGTARVTRTAQGLLLQVKMSAQTTSECARCLEPFEYTLDIETTDLYVFSPVSASEADLVLPEDSIIDLGPIVRDEMLLSIPIKPICRTDCRGLCPLCGNNQNEQECDHQEDEIDPRLDALKSLLTDS